MSAVLVIAGSDSSGEAGLLRDVSTLADLGMPARCALTAVTAQTDAALLAAHVLPPAVLRAQLEAVFATGAIAAVKIGMLAGAPSVRVVAQVLAAQRPVPVVLDPVLVSSSGGELLDAAGRVALLMELLPQVTLLTPNLPEAARLLGRPMAQEESEALRQARELIARGARAVLLKGGHATGPESVDLLVAGEVTPEWLSAPRCQRGMRGTGCALSTAIAAYLARGLALSAACAGAKSYVTAQLQRRSD